MLNTQGVRKRLLSARDLLNDETTTRAKLVALTTLLSGVHPKTDALLAECNKALTLVGKIEEGDVIHLSAEALPEGTEEEKKRKRALLLFLKNWKDLQGEVARIEAELNGMQPDASSQASTWSRIFAFSKGPLAFVAVVAVGLGALSATSVSLTIKNDGCSTMHMQNPLPVAVRGLSLPNEPIQDGGSGVATLPPLTLNVDGTMPDLVSLTALGFNTSIKLPSNIADVTFNGISLLDKKTQISLSEKKEHELVLRCR